MRRRARAAIAVVGLLMGCIHPPGRNVTLGDLRLVVRDRDTKRPIPGVRVVVALDAVRTRGRFLGLVPSVEPDIGSEVVASVSAVTDIGGRALVGKRTFWLEGDRYLDRLFVSVNVAPNLGDYDVQTSQRIIAEKCSRRPRGCTDEVMAAELMSFLISTHPGPELGLMVENPDPDYRGAYCVSELSGRLRSASRATFNEVLRVQWLGPNLLSDADVEVELPRAPKAPPGRTPPEGDPKAPPEGNL